MILFSAYRYCAQKKFFRWCVYIVIAMFIHKSALFLLPLYFFLNMQTSRKIVNVVLLAVFLLRQIDSSALLVFLFSLFPPPYSSYAEVFAYLKNSGSGLISYVIWLEALILNNCYFRAEITGNKNTNVFFNLFLLSTTLLNIFYQYFMITRITDYFFTSVMIMFPFIRKATRKSFPMYFLYVGILMILTANMIKISCFSPKETLLEYHTVFEQVN